VITGAKDAFSLMLPRSSFIGAPSPGAYRQTQRQM
jgi:hypothetical protein